MVAFAVTVRLQRQVIAEFEVEAPDGRSCRSAVRAYMLDKELHGRATWGPSAWPEGSRPRIPHTFYSSKPMPVRPRRLRDTQRSRVYEADRALFPSTTLRVLNGGFDDQRRFSGAYDMQAYIDRLCREHGLPRITVKGSSGRGGHARYQTNTITMPLWTWFEQYLLHEFAHFLTKQRLGKGYSARTEYESHGPEFVAVLHDLICDNMGEAAGDAYEAACRRYGVRMGSRLVVPQVHDVPLAAGPQVVLSTPEKGLYEESYRRYKRGERSSRPKLRKGMTPADAAAIHARVDLS